MVGAKALVFWRQNSNPSLIQYKDLNVYMTLTEMLAILKFQVEQGWRDPSSTTYVQACRVQYVKIDRCQLGTRVLRPTAMHSFNRNTITVE